MTTDMMLGIFVFLLLLIVMGLPLGLAAYISRLRHIERMNMIEKGIDVQPRKNANGKDTLRWGIMITSLGAAITLSMYPIGFLFSGSTFPLYFGPWMGIGLLPLFFGLGLILIYYLTKDGKPKDKEE
jgi:hypothetical protein